MGDRELETKAQRQTEREGGEREREEERGGRERRKNTLVISKVHKTIGVSSVMTVNTVNGHCLG